MNIRPAREEDVPVILSLIRGLAEYERMEHLVRATEDGLRQALFGPGRAAEVVLAEAGRETIGFALFFHNFSTFLGRPGLYLEDLFVIPAWRGQGVGRQLLAHLAGIALARGCGRMEWAVLDWNEAAIGFYKRLGAQLLEDWRLCRLTEDGLQALASPTS
jgi:GNAT superfamily N-acetyltransferase